MRSSSSASRRLQLSISLVSIHPLLPCGISLGQQRLFLTRDTSQSDLRVLRRGGSSSGSLASSSASALPAAYQAYSDDLFPRPRFSRVERRPLEVDSEGLMSASSKSLTAARR
mmetsp:Transcript_44201/g.71962  ORF Transcript_44201/g.71962 Transcript_44201/m.71962 type:complete len:113 (-) Transcript_44201:463-801(-)